MRTGVSKCGKIKNTINLNVNRKYISIHVSCLRGNKNWKMVFMKTVFLKKSLEENYYSVINILFSETDKRAQRYLADYFDIDLDNITGAKGCSREDAVQYVQSILREEYIKCESIIEEKVISMTSRLECDFL